MATVAAVRRSTTSAWLLLLIVNLPLIVGKVPVLRVGDSYAGSVSEAGGTVEVEPPIRADNGPICGYRILATTTENIPFQIFMLDQADGTAELRAKRPLDCEETRTYHMEVAAVSCTGQISPSAPVQVHVQDVNEYVPAWDEEEYSGEVGEGEMAESIVTLTARDRDCSPTFGSICGYSITSGDQPFAIESHGSIRNVRPLSAAESRSHVLSVVARDCGGRESSPVLVTINVLPKCTTSWTDLSTSMTYIPGTGPQPVFPQARLQICPASSCPASRLETILTLHTDHVGVGCDRDTYSLASQRKMCGASSEAVDLLPAESEAAWLKDLKSDRGREASPIYHFDGAVGAVIPAEILSHDLGPEFTVSTWLRHAPADKASASADKHSKEHILCLADDHRKNRHHLSLFLRNCKLVLLVRREYREEERNVFKPAEWRWSLPQVCDDRWHHYAVSVSPAGVELTLDGELWSPEPNNPEIIDDWPLHPAADLRTTLTVGACWHGSDSEMRHLLRGYLAGLAVLPGRREHSEVLKCLVQCSESLQLPATSLLDPGMEMVTNTQGSQVTVDGEDARNMEELVRQVAYLNTREFPAPGRRRLELTTTITCKDGTHLEVPSAVSRILVLPVPRPTITLAGSCNLSRGYEDFKRGVRIFSDLRLSVSRGDEGAEQLEATPSQTKVDKCAVSIFPPLNPDHEDIQLPDALLRTLSIAAVRSENGAELLGADRLFNYEQVLRQVTYTNQKPAYYLNRQFKLLCSELNERFVSNEYVQTLTVLHPPLASEGVVPARPAHHQVSFHGADLPAAHFLTMPQQMAGQLQGHTVLVVVCVCVLLLVLVLTVGVVRLRSAHKRAAEEEVEMAWDDTALNITVNPLEEADCRAMGGARPIESEVDESSEDDMYVDESSEDDEDDEEEDDEAQGRGASRHRLEWDNDI